MRSRLIDVGLALAYAGLIFFLSSQSTFPVPKGIWDFDKVIHFVEYGVLGFLVARAIRPKDPKSNRGVVLSVAAVIVSTLYGASDEFHQYFVPGRSSEGYDVLADAIGSVLGVAAFAFHRRQSARVIRSTEQP